MLFKAWRFRSGCQEGIIHADLNVVLAWMRNHPGAVLEVIDTLEAAK